MSVSSPASPPTALNPNIEAQGMENLATNPTDSEGFKDVIEAFAKSNSEHSQKLLTAINEQSVSFSTAFERLIKAVEAMKQQPPAADNKTAFWTAYKTLADEYDKEIQRKYGNDLDTSLIFAGLFSAVSSAFIIQIQPELQPTPEPTGTALGLLTLLMQNITISTAPLSNTPPTIIIVTQGFLYFSLFSALLAALLAVLGKQWLLHYDSVGERGTISERGLERQRKFDGMQRWKFDLVMQIFPLLLQFALLLFAAALSIYLWTINHVIAGFVFGLTALGCILYGAMVVSAMKSADSPFQTPLTRLLNIVVTQFTIPAAWHHLSEWARPIQGLILLCRSLVWQPALIIVLFFVVWISWQE
ncbi:hypothetical protein C8F04DRAFT_1273245 [Mycena alexandri]|uniref:DUF6535 domain-containing protein n=1 Tax=Mycena alexandri TaxID=1745969 RepID=A0AAD6WUT1_9AGAR|nr:hypothetical protein C8F04DRAFT_1273245 [Mycena alexandri]